MIDCGGSDPLVLGISILVYCTDLSGAKEGYYFIVQAPIPMPHSGSNPS